MSSPGTLLRARFAASPGLLHSGSGTRVDVVVPIHDAYEALERCLRSVAEHTEWPHRLVLIDDGSRDPHVARLLEELRGASANLLVSGHPAALGFVRTANEGLAASETNDVVLLNSDTVVTAGWLGKLHRVARSRNDVATVTPLTNNGTLCTVPDVDRPGGLPAGWTIDAVAALVETHSFHLRPEAPTGVGFCLYVTRGALQAIGAFDEEAFGDGYGEENDFCRRAIARGLVNLIADDTFVYHEGGASFGAARAARIDAGLRVLSERHPTYGADVERYYHNHPLAPFHRFLRLALRAPPGGDTVMRVMHLLHEGGGTERHVRDLAAADGGSTITFVVRSDGSSFDVEEHRGGTCTARRRLPFPSPLPREFLFAHGGYRASFDALCELTGVDVIHVHHLLQGTLDVAGVARRRGIPYCVTLHDYFALCPRYTLLDPDGEVCAGCTRETIGPEAARCMATLGGTPDDLEEHQRRLRGFLESAGRLFVPSEAAASFFRSRYPELGGRLHVVEHGIAGPRLPPVDAGSAPRTPGNPLRVAVIGGLNSQKGQGLLLELLGRNTREEIEFHFFGAAEGRELSALPAGPTGRVRGSRITYHGRYTPDQIVGLLSVARIDLGLQLSTWPETFSYTLSEYAMAGIPVVALPRGAVGERVSRDGLGWIVEDVSGVLGKLEELALAPAEITRRARAMDQAAAARPVEPMRAEYERAWRELAAGSARQRASRDERRAGWEYLLAVDPAAGGSGPGTSRAEADLAAFRQWMRSPRYQMADTLFRALERIPILWPAIVRLGERRRGPR